MDSPFCKSAEGCMRNADSDGQGLCRFHADQGAGRRAQAIHLRAIERRLEKRLDEIRHEIRVLEAGR